MGGYRLRRKKNAYIASTETFPFSLSLSIMLDLLLSRWSSSSVLDSVSLTAFDLFRLIVLPLLLFIELASLCAHSPLQRFAVLVAFVAETYRDVLAFILLRAWRRN